MRRQNQGLVLQDFVFGYLFFCVSLCSYYTLNSYNAHYIIRNEKEIEIAASLGPRRKRCSGFSASGDNDEQAHHDDHDHACHDDNDDADDYEEDNDNNEDDADDISSKRWLCGLISCPEQLNRTHCLSLGWSVRHH